MSIKAIFLDVEGTFLKIKPSVGEIYAKIWEYWNYSLDSELIQERFKKAYQEVFKKNFFKKWDTQSCKLAWKKVFSLTFEFLKLENGKENILEEAFQRAYNFFATKECVEIVPGFKEFLFLVKTKNLKLGIISNWDNRLYGILKEYQILNQFDGIFLGCEVNYFKPHLQIFKKALENFQVKPQESLMIGDSLEEDIIPAKNLGFITFYFKGSSFEEVCKFLEKSFFMS